MERRGLHLKQGKSHVLNSPCHGYYKASLISRLASKSGISWDAETSQERSSWTNQSATRPAIEFVLMNPAVVMMGVFSFVRDLIKCVHTRTLMSAQSTFPPELNRPLQTARCENTHRGSYPVSITASHLHPLIE